MKGDDSLEGYLFSKRYILSLVYKDIKDDRELRRMCVCGVKERQIHHIHQVQKKITC